MSIPVLPTIAQGEITFCFTTMKASQYGGLLNYCAWKEILVHLLSGRRDGTLPPHAGSLTGKVAHNLLEQVLKNRIQNALELENAWDDQLAAKSGKQASDYPWLPVQPPLVDYEKKFRTKLMAEKIWQKRMLQGGRNSTPATGEEEYTIPGLKGRIDLVIVREGFITIVDYKTGAITSEDGKVKPEFILQLKLYALLYQTQTGRQVNKLTAINLAGERFEIPFMQDELDALHLDVIGIIQLLNNKIALNDFTGLANLNEATCKFCQFRPVCAHYWTSGIINPGDFEAYFHEAKTAADQSLFIHLKANGMSYFIKGLSGRQMDDFANREGQLLRVLNTWPNSQPKMTGYYQATVNTALFWVN